MGAVWCVSSFSGLLVVGTRLVQMAMAIVWSIAENLGAVHVVSTDYAVSAR
jgi:hypothetical protein